MQCDASREKLAAYLDGELTPSEASKVASHLRQCAGCAADAVEGVLLKRSVAMAGKRYAPSAQLHETIARSMRATPSRDRSWLWKIVAVPALSVLLLSLAVNLYVGHEKARTELVYSELADLHVANLASASPVDVVSSDRHTVKPWFEGKIPFTFNLPELQGTDFALLGGRVTYLAQTPGAQLIYRIRKHEISVFIFPDRGVEFERLHSGTGAAATFHIAGWTKNGLHYFVVGDVNSDEIDALSRLLKDAA